MNKLCLTLDNNWKFTKVTPTMLSSLPVLHLWLDPGSNESIESVLPKFSEITKGRRVSPVSEIGTTLFKEKPEVCYLNSEFYTDHIKDRRSVSTIRRLLLTGHDVIAGISVESECLAIEMINSLLSYKINEC